MLFPAGDDPPAAAEGIVGKTECVQVTGTWEGAYLVNQALFKQTEAKDVVYADRETGLIYPTQFLTSPTSCEFSNSWQYWRIRLPP